MSDHLHRLSLLLLLYLLLVLFFLIFKIFDYLVVNLFLALVVEPKRKSLRSHIAPSLPCRLLLLGFLALKLKQLLVNLESVLGV